MLTEARIIADSISPMNHRLTTFVVKFPRIVNAEILRHRSLSFNSACSRAIPHERMIEDIQKNGFIPERWMKNHKGMQGEEFFTNETRQKIVGLNYDNSPIYRDELYIDAMYSMWDSVKRTSINYAKDLSELGLTKQLTNRLLEPFQYITLIISGTEWENFFALRAHDAAEIHLQELAYKMLDLYNENEPVSLNYGDWHLPFGDNLDYNKLQDVINKLYPVQPASLQWAIEVEDLTRVQIATARCARVSYMNFEGKDDYEADIKLYNNLVSGNPKHASPLEHCAKVMTDDEYQRYISGKCDRYRLTLNTNPLLPESHNLGWCGNFRGFIQHRKMVQGEVSSDPRVIKKVWKK